MAVASYFQDLTLEGVKWLYVNHMDLLQLGPNSPVFEPMTTANLVYLVVQGSVGVSLVPGAPAPLPKKRLIGFRRVAVSSSTHALHSPMGSAGAVVVTSTVDATMLGLADNSGNTQLFPGEHNLRIEQGPLSPALIQSVKVDTAGPVLIESLF